MYEIAAFEVCGEEVISPTLFSAVVVACGKQEWLSALALKPIDG